MHPSSTVAIIANVIENETIETNGTITFDAEDLRSKNVKSGSSMKRLVVMSVKSVMRKIEGEWEREGHRRAIEKNREQERQKRKMGEK